MRRTAEEAAQTRAALCSAALREFAERGYSATSLDDVSRAAGLTRGAVYHHFASKSDLFVACVTEQWQRIAADVWGALDDEAPAPDQLRQLVGSFCRALRLQEGRQLLVLTMSTPDVPAQAGMETKQDAIVMLAAHVRGVCEQAANDGLLHDGLDPQLAAELVLISLSGMVSVLSIEPWPMTFPDRDVELADGVVRAVMRAVP